MHRREFAPAFVGKAILIAAMGCAAKNAPNASQTDARSSLCKLSRSETRVILLGTGTPNAEPDRSGPALAITVNGQAYLVDCGPGIVRRAAAAHRAGIEALAVQRLNRVFITHLHSDHTVGYSDLILTPWVLGRERPLEAYGPPGLTGMTEHVLKAYAEDIQIRIEGLERANAEGCKVNVHEIEAGVIYQDHNVRVTAFPVKHGS